QRASVRIKWGWVEAMTLTLTLVLLTYTYSIGRVLGPLLALGLAILFRQERLRALLFTWAAYLLSLVPMLVFHVRHPNPLVSRFHILSYINPESSYASDAWQFAKRMIGNLNPWWLTIAGDPNSDQIASIYGNGPVLMATFVVSIAGLVLLWRRHRSDPW